MASQVVSSDTGKPIPNLKPLLPKLEPRRRRDTENPLPYPETPLLPPPSGPLASSPAAMEEHTFQTPSRRILSKTDHELFNTCRTQALVRSFVFTLSDAVAGTPCSAVKEDDLSPVVRQITSILDDMQGLLVEAPPDEQGGSRFGNKKFRAFLDLVAERSQEWHARLGIASQAAVDEVSTYLHHCLGNRSRIDYGSGHELNFILWLLCLYQLGLVSRETGELRALVLRVFPRYLALVRAVQAAYYLEPAGSHGVWGLDDYQFLPFLFGASQLLRHPFATPRAVHQELTLEELGDDYLYLGQVAYVNSTKTVRGLRWHSPMLDDISAARSWEKVEGGMRRMFEAEVLGKLPIMQHFLFGSLIPAVDGMSKEDDHGHGVGGGGGMEGHDHNFGGDCCGIKVPSGIAAIQEMKKRGGGDSLRRIPFD